MRLSAQGGIAPEIAAIADRHVATVRAALHRFGAGGFDALEEMLHRDGFRWKRTRGSLRHQAVPTLPTGFKRHRPCSTSRPGHRS